MTYNLFFLSDLYLTGIILLRDDGSLKTFMKIKNKFSNASGPHYPRTCYQYYYDTKPDIILT